jgi:hypothetical protein
MRKFLADYPRRRTVEPVNDFGYAPRRIRRYEQMNVIRHDFHDFDQNAILCCRRQQDIFESSLDITDKNLAPLFCAPNDVILEAKHCPSVLAVPAISATSFNDHVMGVGWA